MSTRQSWDNYFFEMLDLIGERSTCDRGKCACVIVNFEKRILVTGYAGSISGKKHCSEAGHLFRKSLSDDGKVITKNCVRTIHAEQNAICQAAKNGVSLANSIAYISMSPCRACTMLLLSAGVTSFYFKKLYKDFSHLIHSQEDSVVYARTDVNLSFENSIVRIYDYARTCKLYELQVEKELAETLKKTD